MGSGLYAVRPGGDHDRGARGAARGRAYREPRRRARGCADLEDRIQRLPVGDLLQQTPTQLAALQPHRAGRFPSCWCTGRHRAPHAGRSWSTTFRPTRGSRPLRVLVLLLRDRQPDLFRAGCAGSRAGGGIARSCRPGYGVARHGADRPQPGRPARQDGRGRHRLAPLGRPQPQAARRTAAATRDAGTPASSFFVEPAPFVGRVIFATPHRGSYLAGIRLAASSRASCVLPSISCGRRRPHRQSGGPVRRSAPASAALG